MEGEHAILKETISNAKFLPLIVLHVKFQMGKYLVFTSSNNFKITDNNYRSDIFYKTHRNVQIEFQMGLEAMSLTVNMLWKENMPF